MTLYRINFSRPSNRYAGQDYELFDTVIEARKLAHRGHFPKLVPDEVHAYAQSYGRANGATEYWVALFTPCRVYRPTETSFGRARGFRCDPGQDSDLSPDAGFKIENQVVRS